MFADCPLCLDTRPSFYFFDWCHQGHRSCFECAAHWIREALRDAAGRFPFKCPDPLCGQVVREDQIRGCYRRLGLTGEELQRFARQEIEAGIDAPVYCPNRDCGLPMAGRTVSDDGHAKCAYCLYSFCVKCREAFHPGQGCRGLAETEDLIQRTTRPCPQCGLRVTHYRGHACHHIRPGGGCPGCSTHWCYNCGSRYPCGRCRTFCSDQCSCPDCPVCRPRHPCPLCDADGVCRTCRA